jgi:hypothetical protein
MPSTLTFASSHSLAGTRTVGHARATRHVEHRQKWQSVRKLGPGTCRVVLHVDSSSRSASASNEATPQTSSRREPSRVRSAGSACQSERTRREAGGQRGSLVAVPCERPGGGMMGAVEWCSRGCAATRKK